MSSSPGTAWADHDRRQPPSLRRARPVHPCRAAQRRRCADSERRPGRVRRSRPGQPERNGYIKLDGKCGSNCFDGVYLKDGNIVISEVKPLNADGSIQLNGPSQRLPTQMEMAWIESRAKQLAKGTPSQKETGDLILKAIGDGGNAVTRVVTGVNSGGMTLVKLPAKP
ncbi:hypothetical protein SNE35_12655 [Paucibacter sp. R3-3]|uniref:Uncharacterized protein n=1 Tax=Roseateles agri TaxID=3098619 RepID=A0ABU5DJE1_9BURK|nr:hypothetical protein [Paucibacter sp. R3-3]MDY0745364.1 hypothetical protein [Paucibacter sp. R3-3]